MDRCLEDAEAQARLSDDDQMLLSADNNTNIHSDNRPISTSSRKNSTSTFGLGQRRNSSFADFFENEDFAQSLLSRRHFTWSHDEREQRGCKKNSDHNFSVNDPGIFVTSSSEKTKGTSTKKKLSKVQASNSHVMELQHWLLVLRSCPPTGSSATRTRRQDRRGETGVCQRAPRVRRRRKNQERFWLQLFFCSVRAPGLLLKELTEIIHHTGFPVEVDHLEAVHSLHRCSRNQPCCPAVSIVSAVHYSISL